MLNQHCTKGYPKLANTAVRQSVGITNIKLRVTLGLIEKENKLLQNIINLRWY